MPELRQKSLLIGIAETPFLWKMDQLTENLSAEIAK